MPSPEQFTDMEWIRFLAIEPLSASGGEAVIRMRPRSVHLNHNGTVNAPVLFGLAEIAGAGALVAGLLEEMADSYTVVRNASIEYEAPARGDVTASGALPTEEFDRARDEIRVGRAIDVEVPVTIADAAGRRVCRASFTVSVRPKRTITS